MAIYRGDTKVSGVGKGFRPENTGTEGQVLTKTATGYAYQDIEALPDGGEVGNKLAKTATGSEWVDGELVEIREVPDDYSAMRGPCDEGFHVPFQSEWEGLRTIMNGLGLTTGDDWRVNLHLPKGGWLSNTDGQHGLEGTNGYYISQTLNSSGAVMVFSLTNSINITNAGADLGLQIRPFHDGYVIPTSSWTIITGTLGSAGIFRDETNGLISITGDGVTGYTIADKNCGATTVYSNGDTLAETNSGKFYQRGNNYGFPYTGATSTGSSAQPDLSSYGPGNYYSNSVFKTNWSIKNYPNLRGGATGVIPGYIDKYAGSYKINEVPTDGTVGQVLTKTANGESWEDAQSGGTDYSWVEKEFENFGYDYSAMRGPAPEGFHVPLINEWGGLKNIMNGLGLTTGDDYKTKLHIPFAGSRNSSSADIYMQGSSGYYWSSSPYGLGSNSSDQIIFDSSSSGIGGEYRSNGDSIRCFKDLFEKPTSSWTIITGTLGSAGIFWNQSEGLISITDGTTGYTIMDKNLGATTVYNDGDSLKQANMGNMYQWGNNYGFPSTGSVTTSSTQVDASNYGPGNYYSSSTFIKRSSSPYDWSSVQNDNLRGGETGAQLLSSLELSLRTITREPSSDFTLVAPSSIKDGETYALRCINVDSHTMTLGSGFSNPFGVDLTLSANATDQFVFLAVQGTLELQPQVVISNGTVSQLVAGTTASSDPTIATLITNS